MFLCELDSDIKRKRHKSNLILETLSVLRYSRADQIILRDRWTSEVRDELPVDTLLYTSRVNDLRLVSTAVVEAARDSLVIDPG
jgi:hypothetical protein